MFDVGDKVMLISPDGKARKGIIEKPHGDLRIRTRRGSTYLLPGWRIESQADYEYFSGELPEVTEFIDYIKGRMRLLSVGISSDSGEALILLSFDGENYEKEIEIAPGSSMELPVDVRAIRLQARDKKKPVKYDIDWI